MKHNMKNFKGIIEKKILSLGFDEVGFCKPEVDPVTKRNYRNFLNKRCNGDMDWLERHYEKKIDPKKIWPEVKTILVQGTNYSPFTNPMTLNQKEILGNISAYAKNEDYHKVIKNNLLEFKKWFFEKFSLESWVFVDTSPILEKYFAEKSGLGWQGKHTNLVSKKYGSWLFLSIIFLPIELEVSDQSDATCGICNDCLKICPTGALISENKIDARKCISYLTIEYKGAFPLSIRKNIGNKIYGCDDCLSICPWNKFSKETKKKEFIQTSSDKKLSFFLKFDEIFFTKFFKNSPIKRIGFESFLRNVIIAAGNSKSLELIKYIQIQLNNPSPIIRGASVWALGQLLPEKEKNQMKRELLSKELNEYVVFELDNLR